MRKVFSIIFIVIAIITMNYEGSVSAYKNSDISNQILEQLVASPVEYGLDTSFEYGKEGNALCLSLVQGISKVDRLKTECIKSETVNSIDINSEEISGYIQCVKNEGSNIIAIQLKSKNKEKLDEVKGVISKELDKNNVKTKYFHYVKSKLPSGEVKDLYTKVDTLLKNSGAKNIESVKLENGYSITALTNCGEQIESMGKLIDINIAISSYKSGNYLIIGTPEIMTAY